MTSISPRPRPEPRPDTGTGEPPGRFYQWWMKRDRNTQIGVLVIGAISLILGLTFLFSLTVHHKIDKRKVVVIDGITCLYNETLDQVESCDWES